MIDWFADVIEFHNKFGCVRAKTPGAPAFGTTTLRFGLMTEELEEIRLAMEVEDLPGIADGVVDLIYVALGTLVSYGIDPRPVWEAVHAANMRKVGGAMREDGKIMKPQGWVAPAVEAILLVQEPISEVDLMAPNRRESTRVADQKGTER